MLNAIAYQNARLSYFVNRIIKRVSIKNVSRLLWSPWLNIDFDSYLQIEEKNYRQSIFLAFWKNYSAWKAADSQFLNNLYLYTRSLSLNCWDNYINQNAR